MLFILYFYFLNLSAKLHLTGYSVHNLRYLSSGITSQNEAEDKSRFDAWKVCIHVWPSLHLKYNIPIELQVWKIKTKNCTFSVRHVIFHRIYFIKIIHDMFRIYIFLKSTYLLLTQMYRFSVNDLQSTYLKGHLLLKASKIILQLLFLNHAI